jgi:glutamate dehydrogenase (NAD(P)+)
MGTDAQTIAWMMETTSLVTGRSIPSLITGSRNRRGHAVPIIGSLDRADATGLGVVMCMEEALDRAGLDRPAGIRIAIQGFGSVGRWVARHAAAKGYRVVAVSDVSGGLYDANGLDVDHVIAYAAANPGGLVSGYPRAEPISNADLLALDCDVLVPCALENQITRHNAADVRAFLIVEGATGPVTPAADILLKRRDVTVIPDILANAGGVIVSYFEWVQGLQSFWWDAREVQRQLRRVLLKAYEDMQRTQHEFGVTLRTAAQIAAIKRVSEAASVRGLCP